MSASTESLVYRHLPQHPENYRVNRLSGGISSEIYKVEPIDKSTNEPTTTFTVYRNPEDWWKIDKEVQIRQLVNQDPDILIPNLYDVGHDTVEGQQFGYLIKEFILGEDVHTLLKSGIDTDFANMSVKSLAQDIGFRFAALHRHKLSLYGLIGNTNESGYSSWEEFLMSQLHQELDLLNSIPEDHRLGGASPGDLLEKVPQLELVIGSNQSSLRQVDYASLNHGDAHLGNVIADNGEEDNTCVKSLIDLEESTGGDPEIDIAFMENWLYIFPYQQEFYKFSSQFREGYSANRIPSDQYSQRRLIYHTYRSLSYLRTVLSINPEEFLDKHPDGEIYVNRHMDIINSLAQGNYLQDIELKPLI